MLLLLYIIFFSAFASLISKFFACAQFFNDGNWFSVWLAKGKHCDANRKRMRLHQNRLDIYTLYTANNNYNCTTTMKTLMKNNNRAVERIPRYPDNLWCARLLLQKQVEKIKTNGSSNTEHWNRRRKTTTTTANRSQLTHNITFETNDHYPEYNYRFGRIVNTLIWIR